MTTIHSTLPAHVIILEAIRVICEKAVAEGVGSTKFAGKGLSMLSFLYSGGYQYPPKIFLR